MTTCSPRFWSGRARSAFQRTFLEFLRPFHITPIACNVAQPQEKGKVEKGAIHYIRHNFWPLRTFRDLTDLQAQANQWRDQVANVRLHSTTGHRPIERFEPQAMRPLPTCYPIAVIRPKPRCIPIFPCASMAIPIPYRRG